MVAIPIFLFLALIGAGITAAIVLGVRRQRERHQRLLGWAAYRGFSYAAADPSLVTAFSGPPFGHGSSRRATAAMSGTWAGRPALAFHYRYTTGSGDDSSTHHYAIAVLQLPVPLPPLGVRPKGGLGRLWDSVSGGPDVVVADPAFTAAFHVNGDPRFAYDVLTPATTQRLRADVPVHWRTCGPYLVLWQQGTWVPELLEPRLALLTAVTDGIPPAVWGRLGLPPVVPPDR